MENGTLKTYADYNIDFMGQAGVQIRTLCPECTPTRKKKKIKDLCINTTLNTWFCQHCGWKGGLLGNGKVYTKPKYTAKTRLPEKVLSYFKDRGISEQTLESNKIGYGPVWMPAENKEVNAIQFPFYKSGVVVNIKYRDGKKNFRQAKNAEKCFYGFDNMKNKSDVLIITEGEIDTLTFLECGFHEVVSMPDGAPPDNATNYATKFDFLRSAEKHLEKYKKIILAVDGDSPGKRAAVELTRRIGAEKCWLTVYPDGCKDANDALKKHGRSAVKNIIDTIKPVPIKGLFTATDFKSKLETLYDYGAEKGTKTGWDGIDKFFTVRPGELTIITGIPSSGKSNWLDCLMLNLLKTDDWRFAVYSPENWPIEKHIQTLSEKLTGNNFTHGNHNGFSRMPRHDIESVVDYLDDKVFFIQPDDEDGEPTTEKIINLSKIALFRNGINALIIDPWNEVSHDFGKMTETQYISKELGNLRRFGRLNGIHIFIVAHPQKLQKNAKGKYDAPDMYSISGGAHFRNKADNGICVHRTYNDGEKYEVQIIVQKIRFRDIGQPGMHKLRFEYATGRYQDDL